MPELITPQLEDLVHQPVSQQDIETNWDVGFEASCQTCWHWALGACLRHTRQRKQWNNETMILDVVSCNLKFVWWTWTDHEDSGAVLDASWRLVPRPLWHIVAQGCAFSVFWKVFKCIQMQIRTYLNSNHMCTIRQHSITPSLFCLSKSCFRVARADLQPLGNAHPTQALGLRWPRVLKKRLRAVRQSRTENSRNWSSLIKQLYHGSYSLQDRSEFIWAYLSMPYSSCRVVQFLLQTSSNIFKH